jgi:hypothetical protein
MFHGCGTGSPSSVAKRTYLGDALVGGGLLSSWRATSNAASRPTAAGRDVVVPVVRWGWLISTTVVASVRPLGRHHRPTLDREVVSLPDSLSRQEG